MYNPEIHHRKSLRLPEYDYSAEGLYFITICTDRKKCLFGTIVDQQMMLNDTGRIIEKNFGLLEKKYSHLRCLEYIVMPNHFHCIMQLTEGNERMQKYEMTETDNNVRAGKPRPYNVAKSTDDTSFQEDDLPTELSNSENKRATIGQIVGYFKFQTSREANLPFRMWQRNYFEHIIRDNRSYDEISDYILNNPFTWEKDKLYINYPNV